MNSAWTNTHDRFQQRGPFAIHLILLALVLFAAFGYPFLQYQLARLASHFGLIAHHHESHLDLSSFLFYGAIGSLLWTSLYVLVASFLRWPSSVRLDAWNQRYGHSNTVVGFVAGVVCASLVCGFLVLLGDATVTSSHYTKSHKALVAVPWAAAHVLVSLAQEAAFRALLYGLVSSVYGFYPGVVVSSVGFALAYDHSHWWSVASLAVLGVALVLGYTRTQTLWWSVGAHTGWNWTLISLFGTSAAKVKAKDTFFLLATSGPEYLTGGRFGPEASLVGIVGLLVLAGLALSLPQVPATTTREGATAETTGLLS